MKNLIYQYWNGPKIEKCAEYGIECMKAYAKSIDAEYISDSGKVVGKTTAYGEKPWNDILPGGAAALTYPFACGKALN